MAICLRPTTMVIDSGTCYMKAGLSVPGLLPTVLKRSVEKIPAYRCSKKQLWNEAFHSVDVNPIEHPVLLTENEVSTVKDRETMAEIMFEEFNTPGLYIGNESALSLRWYGRSTGIVVDCGDYLSSVVLFLNGRRVADPTILRYGGRDVNVLLASLLAKIATAQITVPLDQLVEPARNIKEEMGYVSRNLNEELHCGATDDHDSESHKVVFEVTVPEIIHLHHELYYCAEGLFQPRLFDSSQLQDGIVHAVCEALESQELPIQHELLGSVLLCGGSTLFPYFQERFWKDLIDLQKFPANINVIANENRQYSAWLGGCALASTDIFHDKLLVSKSRYTEEGVFIFEKKQTSASLFDFCLN